MTAREPPAEQVARIARRAVEEDLGQGDLTCDALALGPARARGRLSFQEEGVLCGLPAAREAMRAVDPDTAFRATASDGDAIGAGQGVAEVEGLASSLLSAERVMLNFLQRLSGIATMTAAYVAACAGTGARVLDTRKTTPGLRVLERYAVRAGGGHNHRFNLADGILIKDTHLAAAGGVAGALLRARASAGPLQKVGVEVQSLEELAAAIAGGADHVLLDNFAIELLGEAARRRAAGITTEASGGIGLGSVTAVARSGVDFISVGALTHSARAIAIHMDLEALGNP
ncbi:MAG: carboxylating nicotinate-nucleotide diphosphorylase [Acidobacteriota bacterium]